MKTKLIILLLTSTLTAGAQMYFGTKKEVPDSVFNALAQTPPMGWNSWNKFGCNVSEQLIKEARAVVTKTLDKCLEREVNDWADLKLNIREALSMFLFQKTKRSPMVIPMVTML